MSPLVLGKCRSKCHMKNCVSLYSLHFFSEKFSCFLFRSQFQNGAHLKNRLLFYMFRRAKTTTTTTNTKKPKQTTKTLHQKIYTIDTRIPMPPRVMASSAVGLNLRVSWFLPTTHAKPNEKTKNKTKQTNAFTILAYRAASNA